MDIGYGWDTGLLRKLNEDSIFFTSFEIRTHLGTASAGLLAVADGMGGHNAGEVASNLAVKTFFSECLGGLLDRSPSPPLTIMSDAFNRANSSVIEAAGDRELHGMGTTLTAALLIDNDMYIAHIGDSRCYIINTRETLQVTRDHSVVQQLVDDGKITREEARSHPRRNEITRVLGYAGDSTPDLIQVKLYSGDNILICSDGLCGVLSQEKITEAVLNSPGPNQACAELVARANLAGGPDNISVIIAKPIDLPSWQALTAAKTSIRTAS
ncbi:MAG: Stp1/IreP family PP2C-type Ser/Thr phosphatase [Dehalococcoidia bacterium]